MTQEIVNTEEEQEDKDKGVRKPSKLSLFKTKEEMRAGDYLRNYFLEVLSICFWIYTITKIFLFDIDYWIIHNFFANYSWVLDFKLIYILALVCAIWLWVGTRDVIVWFLYIVFYPLVMLLIKLPRLIFKQRSWLLAFAILNTIASFFTNLKYGLIFSTIFLAGFSIALFSRTYPLLVAVGVLLALVFIAYLKSFLNAFKPTVIFQIYSKFLKGVRKWGHASFVLDEEIKSIAIEQMKPKQLEKWNANLQSSVLFNRICLLTARRLRDYQKSDWRVIPSILGLLWLVVLTVVSFSGIYFSLYKLNGSLFAVSSEPTFFTFFYFSFNNLVFNATPEIIPVAMLSQTAYMLQASLIFFLVVIVTTFYISHRTQKSSSELDGVISTVEAEARSMESFIQDEYKIPTIEIAMERLKAVQTGLVQFIYWISKGIN